MGYTFFGQFLVNQGLITNAELRSAMEEQDPKRLAALAVGKGVLLREEVEKLRDLYGDNLLKIGEKAVKRQMMTREQLEYLQRLQKSDWRQLGESLIRRGSLSRDQFNHAAELYRQHQATYEIAARRLPASMSGRADALALLAMTEAMCFESLGLEAQLGEPKSAEEGELLAYGVEIELSGDYPGRYGFCVDTKLADHLGRVMLGMGLPDASKEELLDTIGEFCNIVAGVAASTLAAKGHHMSFGIPAEIHTTITAKGVACDLETESGRGLVIVQ